MVGIKNNSSKMEENGNWSVIRLIPREEMQVSCALRGVVLFSKKFCFRSTTKAKTERNSIPRIGCETSPQT